MKAVLIRDFGGPSVLEVDLHHAIPVRGPGELLVEVYAAGVNPVEYKLRRGDFPVPKTLVAFPKVLGSDLAGVVVESDPGSAFPPGTKVFACADCGKPWRPEGTYAEQISVPEGLLAVMPSGVSFTQAASLPLAGLTAWQAVEALGLQPGQRVLIHAGAGGVGSLAVQLAKAKGLHVTTTCSRRNLDFVKRELGADEAVDYCEQRFEEVYRDKPFDGVIDAVGGDYEARSLSVLKRDGAFVSILASGHMEKFGKLGGMGMVLWALAKGKLLGALRLGPRYHLILLQPNGRQLAELGRLVEEGKVKPIIDKVLPLESARCWARSSGPHRLQREAHEYLEQGHARGKVVLQIKDEK